jgi:uncharacterized repeat protein (TIGR03803 family)
MRTMRPLAALVSFLTITVGAWGSKETVLYDFAGGNDGSYPLDYGRLARDSSGNLFGTTQFGASCSQGTVFQLSPNSSGGWSETVLHTFCGGRMGAFPPAPQSSISRGTSTVLPPAMATAPVAQFLSSLPQR